MSVLVYNILYPLEAKFNVLTIYASVCNLLLDYNESGEPITALSTIAQSIVISYEL
jgi:hypothetical protein